jgi:hypothetical protein
LQILKSYYEKDLGKGIQKCSNMQDLLYQLLKLKNSKGYMALEEYYYSLFNKLNKSLATIAVASEREQR